MSQWLFHEPPPGTEVFPLPALAAETGGQRRRELERVIGSANAASALAEAAPYLLADELCRELRLKGLDLPENGAIPCLDPAGWARVEATVVPEGVRGLQLDIARQRDLRSFLGRREPRSVAELVRIARHFFYEEPLKLLVPYTAPRLPRA